MQEAEFFRVPVPKGFPSESVDQVSRYLSFIVSSMQRITRYGIPMPDGETPYLERLVLHRDGPHGAGTYLHVIYESDGDRDPHDHPFDFESTIVHGSYSEQTFERSCEDCLVDFHDDRLECPHCLEPLKASVVEQPRVFRPGDVNEKKAHQLHRLTIIDGPVVTLVKRGPKVRSWGFQTDQGWEGHKSYIARKFPGAQPTEVE